MTNTKLLFAFLGVALTCILVYAIVSDGLNPFRQTTSTPDLVQAEEMKPISTKTQITAENPQATNTPKEEYSQQHTEIPDPIRLFGIDWFSGFEPGDLREWEDRQGEFLRQGTSPYYQIVIDPVHNGKLAAALTIDTSGSQGSQAAYLAFYDNPDAGWYSAWYYIPEGTRPLHWWIISQWKSTYNNNSDDSLPIWVLNLEDIPDLNDALRLGLIYRPDSETDRIIHYNDAFTIPTGEWFHISSYYKKSNNGYGAVAVWLNGQEIFNLTGVHTALRDNTLYWSINNYSDEITPYPATLYVDDVIISQERIPPEFLLP